MTALTLTMPRLGETMEEGLIATWLVEPGERFSRGQPIVEVETDKTVVEYPALGDGMLEELIAAEGERVAVGAPIARADVADAADWADDAPVPEAVEAAGAPVPAAPQPAGPPSPGGTRLRATPAARREARRAGVALEGFSGSGRRGRIERRDVAAAPEGEPAAGDLAFADTPQGRLAHLRLGPADGEVFVLLHGFGGDHATFAMLAAALARAGRQVVAPVLPAHGRTGIEAGDLDALVAPVAAFAATLPGRLHIVGHSLGGAVAVKLAGRLPGRVAALSLINSAGLGREIDAGFIHALADATTPGEVSHLLRALSPKADGLSDAILAEVAGELARGRLKQLADAVAGPSGQRIDILRDLDALDPGIPVRVLVGLGDRIIPPDHARLLPPRVAVHHFAGSGHAPHWDQPREVLDVLIPGGSDG